MTRDDLRRILEKHRDTAYQGAPTIPNEAALDAMEEAVGTIIRRRNRLIVVIEMCVEYDNETRRDTGEKCPECQESGGEHLVECPWFVLHDALRGSGDE